MAESPEAVILLIACHAADGISCTLSFRLMSYTPWRDEDRHPGDSEPVLGLSGPVKDSK